MFLRGGGDIQLLRCGDVDANPGPNPEPSTSRPSASLRQTQISTPRKSFQSAKDPSLSEVMATLNSINSSLNDKMDGMNASLNGKMDGVKEDVGQLHQEFGTLSELAHWIPGSLDPRLIGSPAHWIPGSLDPQLIGSQAHWIPGSARTQY
ncbi:hypothetical protein ACOMHN_047910 [Nucella lapillus]